MGGKHGALEPHEQQWVGALSMETDGVNTYAIPSLDEDLQKLELFTIQYHAEQLTASA